MNKNIKDGYVDYTKNAFRKQNMYKFRYSNKNMGSKNTSWVDISKELKQIEPVTRKEALDHIVKRLESEIFIERNCSSLKTEDQIARLTLIMQYVKDNLK